MLNYVHNNYLHTRVISQSYDTSTCILCNSMIFMVYHVITPMRHVTL